MVYRNTEVSTIEDPTHTGVCTIAWSTQTLKYAKLIGLQKTEVSTIGDYTQTNTEVSTIGDYTQTNTEVSTIEDLTQSNTGISTIGWSTETLRYVQ